MTKYQQQYLNDLGQIASRKLMVMAHEEVKRYRSRGFTFMSYSEQFGRALKAAWMAARIARDTHPANQANVKTVVLSGPLWAGNAGG